MRTLVFTLLIAATASAAPIVPVSGSVNYARDLDGASSASVSFAGTSAGHSVRLSSEIYSSYGGILFTQAGGASWSTLGSAAHGSATIDGLTSDLFSFGLFNGAIGSLDILKSRTEQVSIAHADLLSYFHVNQRTDPFGTSGAALITTTNPEPSTLSMFGLVSLLYAGYSLRRRHNQRVAGR